jgi:ribosome-associated toxin RatA of RatAB toxin-antitoxin module
MAPHPNSDPAPESSISLPATDAEITAETSVETSAELPGSPEVLAEPDRPPVTFQATVLEGRQRQIEAQIEIPRPRAEVWQVLTDYNALAEFIPNLTHSTRLDHPEGKIHVEQVGSKRFLKLNFSARVVLEMTEECPQAIHFQMVAGDFRDFSGVWQLQPLEDSEGTQLTYRVKVWPKRTMPIKLVENSMRTDLPQNLLAIYQRVLNIPSE